MLRALPMLAMVALAAVCAAFLDIRSIAIAQTSVGGSITHVICVTNEASAPLTLYVDETPEASGPRTGFGSIPNVSYCYRRVATVGSVASIVMDDQGLLSLDDIRTAADFQRLGEQMQALRQLSASCEFSPAMVEQADIEQRQAIIVRAFAIGTGYDCESSVGAPPAGADGLDAFDATRSGGRPIYYETAERQSFALCVASERRLEIAAWPQVRPQLPEDFLPQASVVRTGGGVPWCSRIWLRPGGDVGIWLGAINARQEPNSPDFSLGCSVSADLIAQARAGERRGVLVSVSRRRGQRQCEATVAPAPERAVGLDAFNPPPFEPSEPS